MSLDSSWKDASMTDDSTEGLTRNSKPKIKDDLNLEAKFLQEVHNTSVRDHDGSAERQLRDTDLMIEDLTVQLNTAQSNYMAEVKASTEQKKFLQTAVFNSNLFYALWFSAEDELAKIKNTRWNRFKRWAKEQWEYDIYRNG